MIADNVFGEVAAEVWDASALVLVDAVSNRSWARRHNSLWNGSWSGCSFRRFSRSSSLGLSSCFRWFSRFFSYFCWCRVRSLGNWSSLLFDNVQREQQEIPVINKSIKHELVVGKGDTSWKITSVICCWFFCSCSYSNWSCVTFANVNISWQNIVFRVKCFCFTINFRYSINNFWIWLKILFRIFFKSAYVFSNGKPTDFILDLSLFSRKKNHLSTYRPPIASTQSVSFVFFVLFYIKLINKMLF